MRRSPTSARYPWQSDSPATRMPGSGRVAPGWTVDGEPFDGVVVASGRFRRPRMPPVLDAFRGEMLHAFDYPGAEHFRIGARWCTATA